MRFGSFESSLHSLATHMGSVTHSWESRLPQVIVFMLLAGLLTDHPRRAFPQEPALEEPVEFLVHVARQSALVVGRRGDGSA